MSDDPPPPEPHEFPPPDSVWWPRDHEEAWAAKINFPTKLAGWLVLGYVILSLIAVFIPDGPSGNVDLLSIIAGICILKGSQAWLRYATFIGGLGLCTALLLLLTNALLGPAPPSTGAGGIRFHTGLEDSWLENAAILGFGSLEAGACILALHSRKLVFWTRTTRIWGGIAMVIIALLLGISIVDRYSTWKAEQRQLATFAQEIDAVRHHLDTRGSPLPFDPEPILRANPRIRQVYWNDAPGGFSFSLANRIYDRDPGFRYSAEGDIMVPHTTPSGTRGIIHFHLDPPP